MMEQTLTVFIGTAPLETAIVSAESTSVPTDSPLLRLPARRLRSRLRGTLTTLFAPEAASGLLALRLTRRAGYLCLAIPPASFSSLRCLLRVRASRATVLVDNGVEGFHGQN